ncbi:MAG TPA: CDP-diacylglycerol--glycerol-3-phosphate 3-phosphatidyltransferase [Bacillales bacterium]|nr:CDP-diacylglycerol--glycerol-3-phosphate 3-phosphatidyltransferase [Bacillales bacterium]
MWNLPNQITLSRIALIPIFMILMLVPWNWGSVAFAGVHMPAADLTAALIFIVASCTDWLDGYYARKLNLVSDFGKFVDPLADKLLITAAFVALVAMNAVPAWAVIIILAREFAVSGLRQIAAANGDVIAASGLAKWKTTTQIVAVAALLLHNAFFAYFSFPFASLCFWLAVVMTVLSGWDYFYRNRSIIFK